MLRIIERPVSRKVMSPGMKVSKKYRLATQKRLIKRREYKKLKAIVPSVSQKSKVPKITVIEEAIKYIDELHVALAKRMHLLQGVSPGLLPYQLSPAMLSPAFPFPPTHMPLKSLKNLPQLQRPSAIHSNQRHR